MRYKLLTHHQEIKGNRGQKWVTIAVESTKIQTNDLAEEEINIIIGLSVHDDTNGDPRVEMSLQKSLLETSPSIPLATSSKEPQQQ